MECISKYEVNNAPSTVYYIPNFITEYEESLILKNVYEVPIPKWTCLKNRRLQDYGGIPHKHGMIAEEIPPWLLVHIDKVSKFGLFDGKRANHVLINEYLPGQGIMPHLDGTLFYPTVTTISCGSHTVLEFIEDKDGCRETLCNVLLERRSLIVLKDDMYKKYLHCIEEISEDTINDKCVNLSNCFFKYSIGDVLRRDKRVSLTIRNVPKIAKINVLNLLKK